MGNDNILFCQRLQLIDSQDDVFDGRVAVTSSLYNQDPILIRRQVLVYQIFRIGHPVRMNPQYNLLNLMDQ